MSESYAQEEYLKYLHQSMEMRKEIKLISEAVLNYKDNNSISKREIFELQQTLADLESEVTSRRLYSDSLVNYSQLTSSLCGDTTIITSLNESMSLKKLPTKESEFEIYDNEINEEVEMRHFEYFIIIGAHSDDVCINKALASEILFTYPEPSLRFLEHSDLIKSLAFPYGLFAKSFKENESALSQLLEIFCSSNYREGNSFIFTIPPYLIEKNFGLPEMMNDDKSVLYCCCVVFSDIVVSSFFNTQFVVPRCYCIVSYFPSFELHFEVIYRLLDLRRAKMFESNHLVDISEIGYSDIEFIFKEEGLGLIETYYEYNSTNTGSRYLDVSILLQSVQGIEYTFPENYFYIDKPWLCPLLFSILSLHDFYYLLCAMLLEKNIIFVSENLDKLSSCVLGLQSLILPLKCQIFIEPIVNEEKIKRIDSHSQFVLGYPFSSIPPNVPACIIVKLDDCHLKSKLVLTHELTGLAKTFNLTYELCEMIKEFYLHFAGRPVYIANDLQQDSQKKIVDEIQKFIKWVLSEIVKSTNPERQLDTDEVCKNIQDSTSRCNHEFLCSVARTRSFKAYFDDL